MMPAINGFDGSLLANRSCMHASSAPGDTRWCCGVTLSSAIRTDSAVNGALASGLSSSLLAV